MCGTTSPLCMISRNWLVDCLSTFVGFCWIIQLIEKILLWQDEHETIPFPNEETDFVLSTEEYGELMESKFKDAESKKPIKKEKEEVKKEKVPETPQPVEKKAVKRTRASTAPSPGTPQITPKRRRIWTRKITFLPCKLFRRSYVLLIAKPLMKMLYVLKKMSWTRK